MQILRSVHSLGRRCDSTLVINVCEAATRSVFCTPNRLNESQEKRFEFPFILIGKSTMTFLTGQSWHVLKSLYTAGGPEQRFRRCFADGLDQSLVSSAVQGIGTLLFLELKFIL